MPYEKIIELLDSRKIKYKIEEHEPVFTSEQAAKVKGMPINMGAKSLLLKIGNNFILAVLAGDKKLDSRKVKSAIGSSNLRFATPDEVKDKMDCEIGACYPFGNIIGLATFVDESFSDNNIFYFNPGRHDITIEMNYMDFMELCKPKVADISK